MSKPDINQMSVNGGRIRNELNKDVNIGDHISSEGIVTVDTIHDTVHQGKMLNVTRTFTVANGASVYIHHKCGPTKEMHSQVIGDSLGEWQFTSFKNSVYSNVGTEMDILNYKKASEYVPEVEFHTVLIGQITTLGLQRLDLSFGFGDSPSRLVTGSLAEKIESVFSPNTDILTRWTNNSGGSRKITISFIFYEETPET